MYKRQGQDLFQRSLHPAHVPQKVKGNFFHIHLSFFAQFHQQNAFFAPGLVHGILEGGAAVPDGVPAHALGAVHMSQRHIVEAVEHGRIHVVQRAEAQRLGLAPLRIPAHSRYKLDVYKRQGEHHGQRPVFIFVQTFPAQPLQRDDHTAQRPQNPRCQNRQNARQNVEGLSLIHI